MPAAAVTLAQGANRAAVQGSGRLGKTRAHGHCGTGGEGEEK